MTYHGIIKTTHRTGKAIATGCRARRLPSFLRRLRAFLPAVVAAAILAGITSCAVGPDYVKPAAPTEQAFKEAGIWKVAEPKDGALAGQWWEIFGDSVLNGLEAEAARSNQTIAAAKANYRQARATVDAARAGYFPVITLSASYTKSVKSANSPQTVSSTTTGMKSDPLVFGDYLASGNAAWEPDIWGRTRRNVESNKAGSQASLADLEAARLSIRAELAQDYFQLRTLDGQKALMDRTSAAYQETLNLTRNRYAGGIASKADVLQAETQLKTVRAQAVDILVQRAQLEHAIAALLGKTPADFSIPVAPLFVAPPPIPLVVPSSLLERRPDVAAAERRVAAANAQIGVAVAAFFPSVSLTASRGQESGDSFKWFQWPSHFWSVGPSVTMPIFEGGLRIAQLKQTKAQYDAAVASYRQTVLSAFQEVEDSLAAIGILTEEANLQDEAVGAARQTLTFTTNQYRQGVVGYLNVVAAQTAVLSTERTALDILGRRMTAAILLVKAMGGGWDRSALTGD